MATNRQKKKSVSRRTLYSEPRTPRVYAPDWILVGLALAGLLAALIGLFASGTPLCPEDSGCQRFRESHWASAFGLPVLVWAVFLHLLTILIAWQTPPILKRWRRLTSLALIGMAVTIYLAVAGITTLGAVCPWCLGTFLLSAVILVVLLTSHRHPNSAPGMPWRHWIAQSVGVLVVTMFILHLQNVPQMRSEPHSRLEALAIHLEETGARYYGAHWCPACQEQNELFGDAADALPFVECSTGDRGSPMTLKCAQRDIRSYPTWIIDGKRYEEVLKPEELADHSGFDWDDS
ncbi:MAG: vitamin K epoxide reductase family protein [Pseudomonadota bacterium]